MNRQPAISDLATGTFIARHEDAAVFVGPPGSGKSHSLAQAIRQSGHPAGVSRLLPLKLTPCSEEIADATLDGTRKECLESLTTVTLVTIGDFGMRKLPL